MENQYTHSQVIYRQMDDKEAKELVNSYKFKNPSPQRYKNWNPETSVEDRYKKKREREDQYIKSFQQEDRPILLIKNKEAYKGIQNGEVFDLEPEKEHYYKITQNTQKVDDVTNEIQGQSQFIRKATQVKQVGKNQSDDNSIYKIEGIEYLPEGFLELDPLHYKDEFAFESKIHEKLFDNEQRKVKALRRKQYQLKDQQKQRDVTIFLLNEHKDQLIEFLEQWYFKHKRPMNRQEIEIFAQDLQCDPETMSHLQDLFLNKKRILNTKLLRQYLTQNGKLVDNKLSIPSSLRKYFVKSKNPYDQVSSRVYKDPSQYEQLTGKPMKKKIGFSDKIFGKNGLQLEQNFNEEQQEKTLKQNLPNTNHQNSLTRSKSPIDIDRGMFSPEKQININYNYNKMNNDDMRMYFDEEINRILEKIKKGDHLNQSQDTIKGVQRNQSMERKKSSIKNRSSSNNKKSVKFQPEIKPPVYEKREYSHTSPDLFRQEIQENKKSLLMKHQIKEQKSKSPIFKSSFQFAKPKNYTSKATQVSIKKRQSAVVQTEPIDETKKSSIYFQDQNKNVTISRKLGTIDVGNQYYYQIIEKTLNNLNNEKLTLITKNQEGIIISKKELPIQSIDELSQNQSFHTRNSTIVTISNQKGEIVDVQEFTHNNLQIAFEQPVQNFSFRQTKNCIEQIDDKTLYIYLKPFRVFNQMLQQIIVKETLDNKINTVIITQNMEGLIISEDKFNEDKGNKFETTLQYTIDNDLKVCMINTINENGVLIAQHKIEVNLEETFVDNDDHDQRGINLEFKNKNIIRVYSAQPVFSNQGFYKQLILDQKDDQGRRFYSVITKDQKGEILQRTEINRDQISNESSDKDFFTQILKEDDQNAVLITRKKDGSLLTAQKVKRTIFEVIGEDYDYINYFENQSKGKNSYVDFSKKGKENVRKTILRPTYIANTYLQQIIEEILDENNNVKTISMITQDLQGRIVTSVELKKSLLNGKDFKTETVEVDSKKSFYLITRNEREEVIAKQEITESQLNLFAKEYLENLENQILKEKQYKISNKKISQVYLRPTVIGDQFYEHIVQDTINELGIKDRTLITINSNGKILSAQTIDPLISPLKIIPEFHKNSLNKKVSIVIKNDADEIIAYQDILDDRNSQLKQRPSFVDKYTLIENGEFKVRHTLVLNRLISNYYKQIVEEIISPNGKQEINVVTLKNDKEIDRQIVDPRLQGFSYSSHIVNDYIDNTGVRKVTVEVRNNKNQTISEIQLKPKQEQTYGNYFFDSLDQQTLKTNKLDVYQKSNSTIYVKQLRSSLIGNKKLSFFFIEKVDSQNNSKLTFVAKNADNQIEFQQELDEKLISQNYEAIITKVINELGLQTSYVDFKNEKGVVILTKKFQTVSPSGHLTDNILELNNYYDLKGRLTSFSKTFIDENNKQIKQHNLRPTLLGSAYYSQLVNEVISNNKQKSSIITLNEKGQIIAVTEFNAQQNQTYRTQVKNEIFSKNQERQFELLTLNNLDEVVATQIIKQSLNDILGDLYEDDQFIEETQSKKGSKKLSLLQINKDSMLVSVLPQIKEENESSSKMQTEQIAEFLFDKYHIKPLKRFSLDQNQEKLIIDRAKTFQNKLYQIPENDKQVNFQREYNNQNTRPKSNTPYPGKIDYTQQNIINSEIVQEEKKKNYQPTSYDQVEDEYKSDVQRQQDQNLKNIIREVFQEERLKISQNIIEELEKRKNQSNLGEDLQNEFFDFVKNQLPHDQSYKESMMFVNLFYYFLKKKNLIK